ncbi:hypothetical protein TraAM80_07454 [Trypanosoma rangeli]|uniref:Uncharacterized protein n=1 Tax=Trypanosoma rangeli TaxID=5698 RepID=A0A3R7KSY4_TRYRA|nr:uncharacterized protein TraAM80_07454 [Trypanosoma rangeli]RNF00729.1 hypothetical protein TraAM80_07454 [Trypanosoma rangeli]|eukprot:RNF00729.1 hypothetical protein TraAM80_07454 [Trypanosoma rangeli]
MPWASTAASRRNSIRGGRNCAAPPTTKALMAEKDCLLAAQFISAQQENDILRERLSKAVEQAKGDAERAQRQLLRDFKAGGSARSHGTCVAEVGRNGDAFEERSSTRLPWD